MNRIRIRPLLFSLTVLTSTAIFGLAFWFANYYLAQSLAVDFNVGLYNYAVDLSEAVQIHPRSDPNIPFENYLDKDRVFPFQHGESLVEIYDREGRQLFRYSLNTNAPVSDPRFLDRVTNSEQEFFYDFEENYISWRSLIIAVDENTPPRLLLKVTVPLDFLESQKDEVAKMLLLAAALGVFVLSAILVMVSRLLTKPLEQLSQEVKSLDPRLNLTRIHVPKGPMELHILGESFNELLARVSKLVQAEKEFAASAAHQLKTPLTIARGHIEMLTKELTGSSLETAKVSIQEIDLLAQIVNNLLLLTRIETGISQPRTETVNLEELVTQVMGRLQPFCHSHGRRFRLRMNVSDMAQLVTRSDSHFLTEAIRNLLENSVRYSNGEVIDVTLSASNQDILIEIANPIAAPVSLPPPPYRTLGGRNSSSGHGLGLAIAHKLLSLLGSTLELVSSDGLFVARIKINKN